MQQTIKVNTTHYGVAKAFDPLPFTNDDLPPIKYVEPTPYTPLPSLNIPAIKHPPVYSPVKHERSLVCTAHTQHQTYINYYLPPTQHPTHCPYCPNPCQSHEYDYADVIVTTHQHFTRKAAITCMNHLRQINLARTRAKSYTIEEYLKMAGVNTPSYDVNSETRSACYLHSSCHSCGGTFTILYTTTPVQHTPPKYCVWCGSQDIYTVQADTEETCFITLSLHYNLPLALLKALYNIWHTSSHYQYFSQYMNSEPVTEITSKVQS